MPLLKHRARRYAVLEVVGHPCPDDYVIVSGFGEHAQWYPRDVSALAEPMTRDAAEQALDRYPQHLRTWRTLKQADLALPMVRLELN